MKVATLKVEHREVIPKCFVARNPVSRFFGLMGRKQIPADEALAFPRCNSIHTFFMRFPIDVVMVSGEGEVVEVIESMKAWRMLMPRMKAKHVVELRAGRCRELGISVGKRLECAGAWGG